MAVKKAKEASFKKMDSAFATSQSAIQKVKNTDPLNGNEEQEQGNENVSIDPAHYLSKKEKKEWKRLSYTAKQRYIRQAERQLKRQKKRNGIAKTEPSSVQEKEKQAAKIFSKERKYRSNTWKEPVDKKEIGSHGGNGEIASKSRDSRAAIRSQSTVAGGEKAVDIASSSTSAETAKAAGNAATKTVDTAAASTGAGLAALVAKKTAENFKEMLQQKNTAIESQRIKTQTKLSRLIEENKTAGSPGVAAAAMLASVVVTVMYFAAQIAVTIFFVLLILLIPIIVIVSFLGIIITLLSGFAAAVDNTDYASGSGASIVAVAVQEIGYHEGAGNHTNMECIQEQTECPGVTLLSPGVQMNVVLSRAISYQRQPPARQDGNGLSINSSIKKQEVILHRQEILSILIKAGWENPITLVSLSMSKMESYIP